MQGIQKTGFIIYAAFLSFIGMLASDMYLPTLNQIQTGFHTTEALVGLSVSIYMIGFAFAQLFYGPLSDQIGRKLALLIGLALFSIGTFGCIYSTGIELFLVFRFIQSIGVSAAFVLWQPMVIDLFQGEEVQKIFSMLVMLNAVSPAVAPIIGGYVGAHWSWEVIFWVLQGITLLLLFWTVFGFKESLKEEFRQESFSISAVVSSYKTLLTSPFFVSFSFTIALALTLYFVYLAMIPFVLHGIGFSADEIGLTCLPFALAFMTGSQVSRSLHPKYGDIPLINFGLTGAVVGSVTLFAVSVVAPHTAWALIASFCIITFSNGFIIPTSMAFVIQRHSKIAGACASGIGFLMSFMGFVSTAIASFLIKPLGVYAISVVILGFCAVMVVTYRYGLKSLREEPDAETIANEMSY